MRARSACIASEWPKTMDSGGISPIDCTSELTELVVVIALQRVSHPRIHPQMCTPDAKLMTGLIVAYKCTCISLILSYLDRSLRSQESTRDGKSCSENSVRGVGKSFHIAEASFPTAKRDLADPFSKGRENLRPRRWYPSAWLTRVVRARKVRAALGRLAVAARGALGISSKTCAAFGNERRTATRAPPALMLRAVANSRNSFPLSSRLRTKTGIARGSRVHFRRSFSGLRRIKGYPVTCDFHPLGGI